MHSAEYKKPRCDDSLNLPTDVVRLLPHFLDSKSIYDLSVTSKSLKNCAIESLSHRKVIVFDANILKEFNKYLEANDHDKNEEEKLSILMPSCEELSFSHDVISSLDADSLSKIITHAPNIKSLDLSHTPLRSMDFLSLLPKLKTLTLINSSLAELDFLQYCPHLLSLDLTDSKAISCVRPIGEYCQNLTKLKLRHCSEIMDLSPLANCKSLKKLYLCHLYEITDLTPIKNCLDLTELHLTYCSNIISLEPLSQLKKLENISLMSCDKVTDVSPLRSCNLYGVTPPHGNYIVF